MGDVRALIDSDVFIDHIRGANPLGPPNGRPWFHSAMTRAELFSGRRDRENDLRDLLVRSTELPVSSTIAERAGALRRVVSIALPDAIIAATALVHGLDLVTRNRRHFERVPLLNVLSPEALTE